jgi:hypothetical protein
MASLETYLNELRQTRPVAVKETSYYNALANLFNEVGKTLKPKVRYVITPAGQGAGLPDGGLYTAQQLQRNTEVSPATTPPERGCVEAKGLREDVLKIAEREQVQKYLERYRQVMVTNYRDFLLVGLDENGKRQNLERYTLAKSEKEFWELAAHPQRAAKEHGERFGEYLKRVMLHAAPLASPEDVARFLASYARDARARVEEKATLEALQSLREALEQALGLKFEGEKGEHFFRSTLVQTLFYGIFSAWVLWTQQKQGKHFDWHGAGWYLRVPMISALFNQLLMRDRLRPLGLDEVLDWTAATLNRIEDPAAFIQKFTEGHAVQYFYEPFLQEFDPELRKQLGVWYTPQEIVKYMVERVDTVLREELNVPEGLAGEEVYVLDPCCGTGTYLVEVLRRIEATYKESGEVATAGMKLKEAAKHRVFGFEILPAPFVVAHLQLGLLLQSMDAPLEEAERVGVYLTNALTGWEPPKEPKTHLLFPEMEEERDRAEEVKRERPILVVLGNPPYNAFAGTSPEEEQGLVEAYKEGLNTKWGIRKFNLDDLYVRFFRLAERRIAEKTGRGVVCYISNYSYLSDPSFVVMRERFLNEFDAMWFDSLGGDSRRTGKLTPEGEPDPSIFSTKYNKEGIRVGTAVGLMVRKVQRASQPTVSYREFWGETKRADLLNSLDATNINEQYEQTNPQVSNRYSLRATDDISEYLEWPKLVELCKEAPISGLQEMRKGALMSINRAELENRMRLYYDTNVNWSKLRTLETGLTEDGGGFNAEVARPKMQTADQFDSNNVRRYSLYPFDPRWCYYTDVAPLWNRPRPALVNQQWDGNSFFITRMMAERPNEQVPIMFTTALPDYHLLRPNAVAIPIRVQPVTPKVKDNAQNHFFAEGDEDAPIANLSSTARAYLASLGITNPDADSDTAALIWMHALAIGYSPAYLLENANGIRNDWPRIPLPSDAATLHASAELGRQIAAILAHDAGDTATPPSHALRGIITPPLRPEMKHIGIVSHAEGKQLKPSTDPDKAGDLALTVNWGYAGQKGVTMPGKGKSVERDYTAEERAAIEQGATALGSSPEEAFACLGETTLDVYLNDTAYWRNIPARVWEYHIGGYQVIKKWLSYREHDLLGRDLTLAEASEVRDMARRIAALRLLEPALDANYQAIKDISYNWPLDESK